MAFSFLPQGKTKRKVASGNSELFDSKRLSRTSIRAKEATNPI